MQFAEIQPEREGFRPEVIEGGRSVEAGGERRVGQADLREVGREAAAEQVVEGVREKLAGSEVEEMQEVDPRVRVRSSVIDSIRSVLSAAMSQARKIGKLVELFRAYRGDPSKEQELVNVVSFEATKSVSQPTRNSVSSGNSRAA